MGVWSALEREEEERRERGESKYGRLLLRVNIHLPRQRHTAVRRPVFEIFTEEGEFLGELHGVESASCELDFRYEEAFPAVDARIVPWRMVVSQD